MAHYWIAVACHEHVQRALKEGVAQVCHGKAGPLKKMSEGDGIIYYSPVEKFGQKEACRKFTALGKVKAGEPYLYEMTKDFVPWRRDINYLKTQAIEIMPLLDTLSFIVNKQRWGFPFRRGCFEISKNDFLIIAKAMKVKINE